MQAIRVNQQGGPEVLSYEELPTPTLAAGENLVKIEAIGVNFIDTYQRSGLYKIPLPSTLGLEAAGTIAAVGPATSRFKVGDRVAYTNVPGAYAEFAAVPEEKIVALADELTFAQGAAIMLQGCTAHFLSHSTYPVKPGDVCLVHAAAGGVGLLLTQMIKMRGGQVIATVSTPAKAQLAKAAGADHVILYTEADFEAQVRELTRGEGVNVAYDSVGKTTFEKSINCLAKMGMMVLYGNASGPVTEFNPASLGPKGSLFLTRPTLFDYLADRQTLQWRSNDLFTWIAEGKLSLRLEHSYPLVKACEAHRDLEARKTTGKVILVP
ncbi:MAG: NADPH2:quinone reductase [Pseudohongiellaceae bacterium]|jgi:NADPH2:quinone reductase